MGARSVTIILDENQELCRVYRQMDGYPSGMGLDLAKLCNVKLVNGYSGTGEGQANGMGCLAAQIIAGLKDGCGGIYLEMPNGEIGDWVEYVYIIRGEIGKVPTIECSTKTGQFPFNVQSKDGCVWPATPANKITKAFVAKKERGKADA